MAEQQWVGNLITAFATISVAGVTILGYYFNNKLNARNEKEKFERHTEWEKEKLRLDNKNKQRELKFKIYNKVLMVDGEISILTYHPQRPEFDYAKYMEKIRPILFEEYHILDEDVKKIVKSMDDVLKSSSFFEDIEEEQEELIVNSYAQLISTIENHYKEIGIL